MSGCLLQMHGDGHLLHSRISPLLAASARGVLISDVDIRLCASDEIEDRALIIKCYTSYEYAGYATGHNAGYDCVLFTNDGKISFLRKNRTEYHSVKEKV